MYNCLIFVPETPKILPRILLLTYVCAAASVTNLPHFSLTMASTWSSVNYFIFLKCIDQM